MNWIKGIPIHKQYVCDGCKKIYPKPEYQELKACSLHWSRPKNVVNMIFKYREECKSGTRNYK